MSYGSRTSPLETRCFIRMRRTTHYDKFRSNSYSALVPEPRLVRSMPAAASDRLFVAGRRAPGHAGLAIGREIAEGHVDDQPLLKHVIDRGRDLLLEVTQAGIGQVLGFGPLHKRDHRIAGPHLVQRPELGQPLL